MIFFLFSAVIARFFAFLSGSVLAVFIALSVWDEDVSIFEIFIVKWPTMIVASFLAAESSPW